MAQKLSIYEVGPRDGLQNEPTPVNAPQKMALIDGLVSAGIRRMEATSFVSPKAVPQMADSAEIYPQAAGHADIQVAALIINDKGYDRAREAGAHAVAIVAGVSDTLTRRNSRMTVDESLTTAKRLVARARKDGVFSRVYLAPAWVCPYDGAVAPERVIACAEQLGDDWDELAIADTIGHAHPLQVGLLMEELIKRFGAKRLAVHLHDTQAMGLANAAAAISAGIRTVDSSIGGLGGCPFARGAAGNLATEDLALMAERMGFDTGIDLQALWRVVAQAEAIMGRPLGGRTKAWWESTRKNQHG